MSGAITLGPVDVAIVVVTFNSEAVVPGLLASLPAAMQGCSWRLVTSDNDSRDATRKVLADLAPEGVHLSMGRNAGYAAGINAALAAAGEATAVLVLNPDMRLEPGSGATLLSRLGELRERGVGIVVPRLVDGDGRLMHSLRREPNVRRSFGDAVLGAQRAGRHAGWGEVVTVAAAYERPSEADWATGAAMLISKECLAACGAWDESFFLYSEETEYSLRARDRGYRLVLAPDVSAVHLGGESRTSGRLHALLVVNRIALYSRNHPMPLVAMFWLVAVAREASRIPLGHRASRSALLTLLSPRRWRTVAARARG